MRNGQKASHPSRHISASCRTTTTSTIRTRRRFQEFKADRPFIYLIREKSTGSVLFLGRMTQPNN
ncbi:MAG: hypothetical protein HN494_12225 [Opitutae bacterium]|nr:hypothetical protein [Opitutae bacterium]MBT5380719.1 hypothetical protein [Opitutae bacterium]